MKAVILKTLVYSTVLIVGFVLYVRFIEVKTVFIPNNFISATPADAGLVYEEVYFDTQDGFKLNAWLVKADHPKDKPTFIFCHGNAGNIGYRLGRIMLLHQLGVNVFIFDYRGYGSSQGTPTEKGMYLDAQAAYDYLALRKDISKDKLIAYGVSLGGAAAVDLAAYRPVAALIAESTFTSAAEMGRKVLPFVPSFLITFRLDSVSKIKGIKAPKLIIHSPQDEIVPFSFGQKLFEAAQEPKEFLEISGSHNDGYEAAQERYLTGLLGFLKRYNLQ